jgi:hypothetical protein
MRLSQTSARGGLVLLAALVVVAAFAGTAQATVTTTAVTGLPNPFHAPFYDAYAGVGVATFGVHGTSNGTAGDAVDVLCVNSGGSSSAMASNVPVQADGSWDAGQLDSSNVIDNNCTIRAVPTGGGVPADPSPFAGPLGTFPYYNRFYDNNNSVYRHSDYIADLWGSAGDSEIWSSGDFGLGYQYPVAPTGYWNSNGWAGAAALYSQDQQTGSRSELNVDGQNAYNAYGALNVAGSNFGRSAMVTSFALDQVSGNYTTTEDEDLVVCPGSPSSNYPPSGSNCPQFMNTGVHFTRKVVQDHDGRLVTIIDSYTSIDGKAHTLTARYDNQMRNATYPNAEFAFPGQSGLNLYKPGDVVSGPFPAPASIQGATDYRYPASYAYPRGYLTWDTAPNQARFYQAAGFILDYLNRTIPAGGSLTLRFAYDSSPSQSISDSLHAAAVAAFTPPAPPPTITPTPPLLAVTPPAVITPRCVVPPVPRGARLADAEKRIRLARCSVSIKRVFSATPKGRVVSIAPAAGTTQPAGTTVTIHVSKGRRSHAHHKH